MQFISAIGLPVGRHGKNSCGQGKHGHKSPRFLVPFLDLTRGATVLSPPLALSLPMRFMVPSGCVQPESLHSFVVLGISDFLPTYAGPAYKASHQASVLNADHSADVHT